MESGIPGLLYKLALLVVIAGHIFFAYGQWFKWPKLCEKLTNLVGEEVEKTAFLGRSFASYNFSIGCGLLLCMVFLDDVTVEAVVLIFVVATAFVGAKGTSGNSILLLRLVPAAVALLLLIVIRLF